MADTIKLPGIGPTKKVYVIAGVAVLGGVLAYAYWKRSQAPADTAGGGVVDATGADGFTEDSTAAGYNMTNPPSGYSPYGYDLYGNPLPPPTGAGSNGVYTTNADWVTAAEAALESETLSISTIGTALARVLGGLSVTSAQREIFLQAIGVLGQPPQGYPTPIKLTDTPGDPAPSGALKAPAHFRVTSASRTTVSLIWDKVDGAASYHISSSSGHGHSVAGSQVQFREDGLKSNHTYHYHIWAYDAHGARGASSATITARTDK